MTQFYADTDYVAIDIETTGLDSKMDSIIEIGAVCVQDQRVTKTYHTFVNSGRKLPQHVKDLTGITQEQADSGVEPRQAISEILSFTEGFVLLGHNILFDYGFIKRAAVNQGEEFERSGIDTYQLAKRYLTELENRKLKTLCDHFGILFTPHRALEDARAAHEIYVRMAEAFGGQEDSAKNFIPRRLLYKVKKEAPATRHQKEKLYDLIDRHTLIIDYNVECLTRNQASRYTDQILAAYGR